MKKTDFPTFERIILECLVQSNAVHAGTERERDYLMTFNKTPTYELQFWPRFDSCAFCFKDLIAVAQSLGYSWYISTKVNEVGENTPCLCIF